MKKTIALLAAVCSFTFASAQEQTATTATQPQKPTGSKPEMMASRHTKHLEKMLVLNEDQSKKTYDAMLVRFTEAQAIREKAGANADKKALRQQLKPVRQKFVTAMNGILTAEQKTKWEEHRKLVKKNRAARKDMQGNPPPPGGANGDMKKLTDDDDGIED